MSALLPIAMLVHTHADMGGGLRLDKMSKAITKLASFEKIPKAAIENEIPEWREAEQNSVVRNLDEHLVYIYVQIYPKNINITR